MIYTLQGLDKAIVYKVYAIKNLLKSKGFKLVLAESCTGGEISSFISRIPGSSSFFLGGVVVYSYLYKNEFLKVDKDVLDTYGTVSEEVASVLAVNIRNLSRATIGLSVVCVLGPKKDEKQHEIGTLFVGVAIEDRVFVRKFFVPRSNRIRMKKIVVLKAFCVLEEVIKNETFCGC